MDKHFGAWVVKILLSGLPLFLLGSIGHERGFAVLNVLGTSPEVIYTIVVLSGLATYDLVAAGSDVLKQWWAKVAIVLFGVCGLYGTGLYGIIVWLAHADCRDTSVLQHLYPVPALAAVVVVVVGFLTESMIGVTERRRPRILANQSASA